jgi:Flp pilus assembly protein TadD
MSTNSEDRIHQWRNMVIRDGSDQFAHAKLAAAYLSVSQTMKAVAEYRRVVELNPGNAEAWLALGNALKAAAMMRDAEAAFATADSVAQSV